MPNPLHTLALLGEKKIHYRCPICQEDDRFDTFLTYIPLEDGENKVAIPVSVIICKKCDHIYMFRNTDPD